MYKRQHWYAARDIAIIARLKYERAVVRHNNRLMSKSFTRWREFVALSRRRQLLRRQCVWLLETRLVASHFLRWQEQLAARQRENSQTTSALWHWSVVLQHKVRLYHFSCTVYSNLSAHYLKCSFSMEFVKRAKDNNMNWSFVRLMVFMLENGRDVGPA